jgi:Protein kinase domain/Putative zinc-finger
MSPCPADARLRRLLADALSANEVREIEQHLDECPDCRRRLDGMAGVTAVGYALDEARERTRTASPDLDQAIKRLQFELTAREVDGHGDLPAGTPALPPSTRPEFIGRLGGIEIRRVIGRGGMGVVYEGLDPALDRTVAVKVLSPHLVGDSPAKERFLREARAAAALADDHVVTIHAIDQVDGLPFLVLQYVAGESLADRLTREGRLPVEAVARIGAQVARGLAAAHASGLVHRDVKPANILIEQGTGIVRLTDFGLAKLIGQGSVTAVGTVPGTPGYMSPEQAAGHDLDERSDLFSLGVVLYAAAVGRPPFSGDSPFVVLDQIRTRSPVPLAEVDPSLPDWFCSVVDGLLAKEPGQRIQTAAETADLLERRVAARPAVRRRTWVYRAIGAAGVVAAAVGLGLYLARPHGPVPDVPVGLAPAVVIPPGFVIVSRPDHFKTLGEAVRAAADGDLIEVRGDGPHLETRVEIRGKRLTLRAAPGYRPRIQPAAPGRLAEAQWLNSDSDLTVEGLDILWPVIGAKSPLDPTNMPATIGVLRGRLTVRGCRIVCGRQAACILTAVPELTIADSHLVSDGGVAVVWRSAPGGVLRVTGSQLESESGVVVSFLAADGGPTDPAVIEWTSNTLVVKGACAFIYPGPARYKVQMQARRNLISATYGFGVLTRPKVAADTTAILRQVLVWTERDNVYSRRCKFLAGIKLAPLAITPAGLDSIDEWLAFWKLNQVGSIEGDIHFHPRATELLPELLQLDRIDNSTGPVPSPVGAGELPFK